MYENINNNVMKILILIILMWIIMNKLIMKY